MLRDHVRAANVVDDQLQLEVSKIVNSNSHRNKTLENEFQEEIVTNEVILCANVHENRLGCSIFDFSTGQLDILYQDYEIAYDKYRIPNTNDDALSNEVDQFAHEVLSLIESLLFQYDTTKCLVAPRLPEECLSNLQKICSLNKIMFEICSLSYFKDCNFIQDLNHLDYESSVLINNLLENKTSRSSVTYSTICCLFTRNCNDANLTDANGGNIVTTGNVTNNGSSNQTRINSVKLLNVNDRVFIDSDTMYSLNIFPRLIKTGHDNNIKEGCFSIMELLDKTSSSKSRKILRGWLASPICDKKMIQNRHDVVETMVNPNNRIIFENLCELVRKCPDISNIFTNLKNNVVKFTNWNKLKIFLGYSQQIASYIRMLESKNENIILSQVSQTFNETEIIEKMNGTLTCVINFEESLIKNEVSIIKGVNCELDEKIRIYEHLENILINVTTEVEDSVIAIINSENINVEIDGKNLFNSLYIPQLGYLVSIEKNLEDTISGFKNLEWEEIFRTSTTIYYKNEQTRQLDSEFGDIYAIIQDYEVEIMLSLLTELIKYSRLLNKINDSIAYLDVFTSFAQTAIEMDYVRPHLEEKSSVLEIENGRHPIYETLVPNYIPNSFSMASKPDCNSTINDSLISVNDDIFHSNVCVITGANASGKSVFLSQIGLIVYLAHIGSYVPAKNATIGIVDKILSKIELRETITNHCSSFELDSRQLSKCLTLATNRSLLLIDEFGKGTDVLDGPALFGAIVSDLIESNTCSRVIATTHFHELFRSNITFPGIDHISHYSTEILLAADQSRNEMTEKLDNGITFLYKLGNGLAKQSFGIYCASISGIDQSIVERAFEFNRIMESGHSLVEQCTTLSKKEQEQLDKNLKICKKFLSWDFELETLTSSESLKKMLQNLING